MQYLTLTVVLLLLLSIGCAEKYQPPQRVIFVEAVAPAGGDGGFMTPYNDLQNGLDAARNGDQVVVAAGTYRARPDSFSEQLCGNCENHQTAVQASRGFLVERKAITISGINPDSVILITNAGYGIYFDHCPGSVIENCRITGGVRDLDGNATDAAIVAKFSKVTIRNCRIVDNDHQLDSVVVGIGGIMGREGSELHIHDNYIYNNGWDGIALYRGATAVITDNHIEKGRGAGIGITWDAAATILRNHVSHYWKGIGSFGTSRVTVRNNIVMDCLGWGIIATGTSFMEATNNLIYRNGNCGFANWGDKNSWDNARGICANNIIMLNGWREEWVCPCVGVWMLGKLADFPTSHNNVFANVAGAYREMQDWTGKYGNVALDPLFADTITFKLASGSPLIDTGHPDFTDPDGSPSDIGPWGGPSAKRE